MSMKNLALDILTKAAEIVDSKSYNSNAQICINDAISLFEKGNYEFAIKRAEKSVLYSVGIYSIPWVNISESISTDGSQKI